VILNSVLLVVPNLTHFRVV